MKRLIGHKKVEIALLKNFFNWSLTKEEKIILVGEGKDKHVRNCVLSVLVLAKSSWYYTQQREDYESKYDYLRKIT